MKIHLAKSAGFCFGVKRAIDIALKTVKPGKRVYMFGDIVHNEVVVRGMHKAGIKKIKKLSAGKNKIFLIQAHGIPLNVLEKARRMGYKIVDATCPMVKEIHKIAQNMEGQRRKIIVIGDKQHSEVRGIVGHLKTKAIVIDNLKTIPLREIKNIPKACVVVQSTQNMQNVLKIVSILKKRINDLKFFNTICRPTRMKQEEIKVMPLENDAMIIIGSKNSANTKRLYEISKSLNKRSYWVNATGDLRQEWFKKAKTVGISAGASTPDSTTQEITKYIKQLN